MKKVSRILVPGLLGLLGACQWPHTFCLEDIDQLTPGESTKEDIERILGPRDFVATTRYSSSECDRVTPAFPLSLLTWPLYLSRHERRYDLLVRVDSGNVMESGSLLLSEETSDTVLLLFGPNDPAVHLEPREVALLRNLERKGIEVWVSLGPLRCFGGIIGYHTVPLEEYLKKKD